MVRIYTRTGDEGQTGLGDGTRVAKSHPRVAACGELDELGALLGVALASEPGPEVAALLLDVQRDLLAAGADLARPRPRGEPRHPKSGLAQGHVDRLEAAIDRFEAELPPLSAFLLPGGGSVGAHLHLCRAVCRRVERTVVGLAQESAVEAVVIVYLNRLSDLLFVLARHANQRAGRAEERW